MEINELFDNRKIIAVRLKDCLRDKGFTKISFAEKIGISRPTLDKLLSGEVENKVTFDKHIQKILNTLAMTPSELAAYRPIRSNTIQTVNSGNAPENYRRSERAKNEFELLLDVIDLCSLYY